MALECQLLDIQCAKQTLLELKSVPGAQQQVQQHQQQQQVQKVSKSTFPWSKDWEASGGGGGGDGGEENSVPFVSRGRSNDALNEVRVELECVRLPELPFLSTRYTALMTALRRCDDSLLNESNYLKSTGRCGDSSVLEKIRIACSETERTLTSCMRRVKSAKSERSKIPAQTALAEAVFTLSSKKLVSKWLSAQSVCDDTECFVNAE
jgi:hypothetical protein